MIIVDPGHRYDLACLDAPNDDYVETLTFVKREGDKYPGNVGHHPGTNIQEVLRAIIDRLWYLDNQDHDDRNEQIIFKLRDSIYLLEKRAADRHNRQFFKIMTDGIEGYDFCKKCGHIGCKGECHE